jgi:hypothetical protein
MPKYGTIHELVCLYQPNFRKNCNMIPSSGMGLEVRKITRSPDGK